MSKGRKRKKAQAKSETIVDRFVRPTEAREAHNDFRSAGPAVRVTPVIDSLLAAGKLSHAHYDALKYYRDQATQAEDDCAQSSTLDPDRIMGGSGGSFGSKIPVIMLASPAIIETSRIERDLGALWEATRQIVVDDKTVTQCAIERVGGREGYDERGRYKGMEPLDKSAENLILLELRVAAGRISR